MAEKEKTATDAPPKSGGKNQMIMMMAGMLVTFIIAFLLAKQMTGSQTKVIVKDAKPEVGEHVVLDEFLINLADPTNDKYLKTTIALGLKKGVAAEKFKDEIPPVRDAMIMTLTAKKLDDVRSLEGKQKLKKELLEAIKKALDKDDVVEIDFQSFATQ
jgi:flagellar FliL protein